jgi:acetyl-CoA acetyltransferase family protein
MPLEGREALIVGAVRSPVGRGHREKGVYAPLHPLELLGQTYEGLFASTGVDPAEVGSVVAGTVYTMAEQAAGVARNAWLSKGLPEEVPAVGVDVRCGSGQEALNIAALKVAAGVDDLAVAAGLEHMGRVGFPVNAGAQEKWGKAFDDELLERYALVPQGEAAELIADKWEISRAEMDELALHSHRRAAAAAESGEFDREIVPIEVEGTGVSADQGIRPDSSPEALAGLKPAFRADGRVTAGNSSQISDGAAALLIATPEKADELGLAPRARIVDQVVVAVDPVMMLTGPIPATTKILERNRLALSDLDAIEINEAFASVVIAWAREHGPDMEKVNARGGAIALGHPLGSTGARLTTTLLHQLEDTDGELGLVTMCCAGGVGTATLIQRV